MDIDHVSFSLIGREEDGNMAVSCVTMGLCLLSPVWSNWVYFMCDIMTAVMQTDQLACKYVMVFWGFSFDGLMDQHYTLYYGELRSFKNC